MAMCDLSAESTMPEFTASVTLFEAMSAEAADASVPVRTMSSTLIACFLHSKA